MRIKKRTNETRYLFVRGHTYQGERRDYPTTCVCVLEPHLLILCGCFSKLGTRQAAKHTTPQHRHHKSPNSVRARIPDSRHAKKPYHQPSPSVFMHYMWPHDKLFPPKSRPGTLLIVHFPGAPSRAPPLAPTERIDCHGSSIEVTPPPLCAPPSSSSPRNLGESLSQAAAFAFLALGSGRRSRWGLLGGCERQNFQQKERKKVQREEGYGGGREKKGYTRGGGRRETLGRTKRRGETHTAL